MTSIHFDNFESMLELLQDKVVQTQQGAYIRISDLEQLNRELAETRKPVEGDQAAKPKTFEAAKKAAREDPELLAMFERKAPRAPALDGQVKNVAEGAGHVAT